MAIGILKKEVVMLKIKINNDGIHFLQWLACIKRYESLDIIRVIEKPEQVSELYKQFERQNNG